MLEIVLLAGKFLFLLILYVFVYRVVRSTTRELRMAAPAAGRADWSAPAAGAYPAGSAAEAATVVTRGAGTGVLTLVVQKSPCLAAGAAFPFPAGSHALAGRSSDMDIHLEDTFVSTKHALIEATPEGLLVEDLRSTNGTQVNGAGISDPTLLLPGDRVEVGDTVFLVEAR